MLKKIIILILELALMIMVCYAVFSFLNSVGARSDSAWKETAPWCVTEFQQGRGW